MAKLTPEHEREVLAKAAEGWSSQAIADHLTATYGVRVTSGAIRQRLGKTKTERADIAKSIVREKLAKTLAPDLDDVDENAGRLMRLIRGTDEADDERLVRLIEQHRKLVDTRLKYSGADQPDDVVQNLAEFLARGFGGGGASGAS